MLSFHNGTAASAHMCVCVCVCVHTDSVAAAALLLRALSFNTEFVFDNDQ